MTLTIILSAGASGLTSARADADAPVGRAAVIRTIGYRAFNATAHVLTLNAERIEVGEWRDEPAGAGQLRVGDATLVGGGSIGAYLTYNIGNTGYSAELYASNPLLGPNLSSCRILKEGRLDSAAPYSCEHSITSSGHNDANAYFVIQPRAAATHAIGVQDTTRRRETLDAVCGADAGKYESCGARTIEDVSYSYAPEKILGNYLVNCSSGPARVEVGGSETTGTSTTLGVTVEAKKGLWGALKIALKASYSHTWASSREETTTQTMSVPADHWGYLEKATAMQNVRADYVVLAGNQTYEIPSVTVSAPATEGPDSSAIIGRVAPIPSSSTACQGRGSEFDLPVPRQPAAGRAYRIGLRQANQRVITASSSDADNTPLTLGRSDLDTSAQEWEFDVLPGRDGYQLHNLLHPGLCLGQGSTGDLVRQVKCAQADSPSVLQQLWRITFDPVSGGSTLNLAADGYAVAAGGDSIGATLSTAPSPDAIYARWELESR